MNETAVLIVLGLVAAVFVLRPLLRGRGGARAAAAAAVDQPVHPTAPDELAELELDRAMGRVSEADYERWRGELVADLAPAEEPDAVSINASERAEALIRKWREAPRPNCPNCGLRPEPEARYCSNCGTELGA